MGGSVVVFCSFVVGGEEVWCVLFFLLFLAFFSVLEASYLNARGDGGDSGLPRAPIATDSR